MANEVKCMSIMTAQYLQNLLCGRLESDVMCRELFLCDILDPALIAPCKVDVAASAGASWFRNVWKSPLVSVWKPPVRYRDV